MPPDIVSSAPDFLIGKLCMVLTVAQKLGWQEMRLFSGHDNKGNGVVTSIMLQREESGLGADAGQR
jgi:hypothetical protein